MSALQQELIKDIQHIGERLGLPVITEGHGPYWKNVTLTLSDTDGGDTDMNTFACTGQYTSKGCWVYPWNSGTFSPCNVVIWHNRWTGQSGVSDVLHVQLTHEVVHRVSVYASGEAGNLQTHVDGASVDLSTPMDLGAGAFAKSVTKGVEVDFPDGTVLWALSVGHWGVNAVVQQSADLKQTGAGLLGAIVKGGLGVPALPDGTRLPAAVDQHARFAVLYGRFADAWRVTDATSLFDYDAGKSTASYTDHSFPAEAKTIDFGDLPPEQMSQGEIACGSITDADLHYDCVYDVAATGESGFSQPYAATQTLFDSGISFVPSAPAPTVLSSEAPLTPGFVVTGAVKVTDLAGISTGGASMGPGNVLYLSIQVAPAKGRILAVDATTGSIIHQLDVTSSSDLRYAGGSLFAADLEDAPGSGCLVTQFDAGTLAKVAIIKVPCTFFGEAQVISNGDELWYVDVTAVDAATGKGAVLRRLKTSPSQPDASAPMPFTSGYGYDSQRSLFFGDLGPGKGMYRLDEGTTAFVSLGEYNGSTYAAGDGFWQRGANDNTAEFVSGESPVIVPDPGVVVGGAPTGVYEEITGPDASAQLWRQPADGSAAVQLATAPTVDGQGLEYFNDFPRFATNDGYVQLWIPRSAGASSGALYLQWAPLP